MRRRGPDTRWETLPRVVWGNHLPLFGCPVLQVEFFHLLLLG
jgi:hypothetical protein